jgi:hypothetical protein
MSVHTSPDPTPSSSSSRAFQWMIGVMLLAYVATSVDFRSLYRKKSMMTIGSQGWSAEQTQQRIRQEIIMTSMDPFAIAKERSLMDWLNLAVRHEVLDQEAMALGLDVSEECAKRSLQYKLAFLDANGQIDVKRCQLYYQNHVDALVWDRSMIHDENTSWLDCDHRTMDQFWTQRQEFTGDQSTPLPSRIQKFLVKNRITWGQLIEAERRFLRRIHLKQCVINHQLMPQRFLDAALKGTCQKVTYQTRFFPALATSSVRMTSGEIAKHKGQLMKDSPKFLSHTGALTTVLLMRTPNFKTLPPHSRNGEEEAIIQALDSGQTLTDVAKKYAYDVERVTMDANGLNPMGNLAVDGSFLPEDNVKRLVRKVHENPAKDKAGTWFQQPVMVGGTVWVQVHAVTPSRPLTSEERDSRVRMSLARIKAAQEAVNRARSFQTEWQKAGPKDQKKLAQTMRTQHTSSLQSKGESYSLNGPDPLWPWDHLPGPLWRALQTPDRTMQIVPQDNGCWVVVVDSVQTVEPTNAQGAKIDTNRLKQKIHDQWAIQAYNQWMQRVWSLSSVKTDPEQMSAWSKKNQQNAQDDEDTELELEDMD